MDWSWRRWVNLLTFPSSKYKIKLIGYASLEKKTKKGKENVTLISACCMCYPNQNHLAFILWALLPMPIPCFLFLFFSFFFFKIGNSMFSHYNKWTFIFFLNYKKWKNLPWFISNQEGENLSKREREREREKNHRIRNKEKKEKGRCIKSYLPNSNSNSKVTITF